MQHRNRTSLRVGVSLAILAVSVLGLLALVSSGLKWPSLQSAEPAPASTEVADATTSPWTATPQERRFHRIETRNARYLQSAFDRMGFDLSAVAAGHISVPPTVLDQLPPDMGRISDLDQRKDLFLRALLPIVLLVDDEIARDRLHLMDLKRHMDAGDQLGAVDVRWLLSMGDTYDVPDGDPGHLLKKVDVIPPSLVLAQAIEESGWGTSRLARTQNALFGQFGQADGSSPADYLAFQSLTEAVRAYAKNLNTHRAYREFRVARWRMRHSETGELDADTLAGYLHRYSERGDDYVKSLRIIMRENNLDAFDFARLRQQVAMAD